MQTKIIPNRKTRVQFIQHMDINLLQDKMNDWLRENDREIVVKDIKIFTATIANTRGYTAMIVYYKN